MIQYKTISLADRIYDKLEADILNGTYPKGEIISENRLSEELGVSRTPIREAINRLEYEKLVKETTSGMEVVGLSLKDVGDFFEVKMRIELLATRWAASNITEEQIKELEDIVGQQEFFASKGDIVKVRDLDTEFHDIIYKSCGSQVLESILSPIHHKLMKYRQSTLQIENRIMDSVKEHKAILLALKAHDRDKVDALILVHLEHAYNCILELTKKDNALEKRRLKQWVD